MNSILLWLGIVVALVLSAAFAAPFFIDWSGQRAFFEARASSVLGRPVEFAGPLEVRLMPFPSLIAQDVRVGAEAELGEEGADQVVMRAALAPLLSGELQISEIILTRPRATFAVDEQGRPSWAARYGGSTLPIAPDRTRIDRFEIRDGTIAVEDARTGERYEMAGLNLAGSAGTLAGPFRAEGGGTIGATRYTLRLATGRLQDNGTLRVTGSAVPADRPLAIDIDGSLTFADDLPGYSGSLVVERPAIDGAVMPWRLEGSIAASAQEISFERLLVQLGPQDQRVSLAGQADFQLGEVPRFDAFLSTRQIDFDRTFGGGPDEPVTPAEVLSRLSALLDASIFPAPGNLAVEIPSIVLSGNIVENLVLDLDVDPDRWRIEHLAARIPGRADLAVAGTIDFEQAEPAFSGRATLGARQAGITAGWLFGPDAAIPGLGVVAGELDGSANFRLGAGGLELEQFEVESSGSRLAGTLSYAPAVDDVRARLAVRLDTDRFDLDSLKPVLGGSYASFLAPPDGVELDVQFEARTLVVGPVEIGDVGLIMASSGGDVWVERFYVGDFGGARLDGEGDIRQAATAPDGSFALDLEAQSLEGFANALTALGFDEAAAALGRRAAALVPARLALSLSASRTGNGGSRGSLTMKGDAGGTSLDLSLGFDGRIDQLDQADINLSVEAVNPAPARLVEQFGLAAEPAGGAEGRVALAARGIPADAMPFTLTTSGIGMDGSAEGHARFTPRGGRDVTATFGFNVPRAAVVLDLAGIELPEGSDAPVRLDGQLSAVDDVWRLTDLVLTAGGQRTEGTLVVDWGRTERVLEGSLRTPRLELPWLLGALLGPDAFAIGENAGRGEGPWPEAAFAPVDWRGWRGRVRLETPRLGLWEGIWGSGAELELAFDGSRLSLQDISASMFGGTVSGDLEFGAASGTLRMDTRLDLTDARLEEFVWRSDDRPLVSGKVSAGIEAAGTGRSFLGLISTLSGDGSFQIQDGTIRRLNPRAFDQIVRAADAGLELTEGRVRDVFAGHLDAGSLSFERAEGAFAIASGVVRARNIRLGTEAIDSFLSASVDLSALDLESEWMLRLDSAEEDSRTREVGIVFAGPVGAPERSIDVNPLLGYLTVRAFEQEVQRLERLQADISERERLGRELLRLGEQRQRRERDAVERERRQAEEERQREAEEERQREAEEQNRLQAEEDARLRAAEEARAREEEAARRAAEEARRQDEEAARARSEREAEEQDAALRRLIEDALRDREPSLNSAPRNEGPGGQPEPPPLAAPQRGPLVITPPGMSRPMLSPAPAVGQSSMPVPPGDVSLPVN